uniref:RING-type domain-containing protein n=1 Tax=Rhizophora mucronata TaxID=61149 RepID=A0A2P2MH09_RHIMU
MTLILGVFGSITLTLGPHCSLLVQTNSFFVQSIQVEAIDESKAGPMLYGFYEPPPLDTAINWTETHEAIVPANFHKEWVYFLNNGSKLDIFYSVKSSSSLPLCLVIAQGRESLVEWIEDPTYPSTTLSWNIIYGSGRIQQDISRSFNYYIAVGNSNNEEVEVELNFKVKAFIYNTTKASNRCSMGKHSCSLRLFLFHTTTAVLTSPGPKEDALNDHWHVKLSYGPRWITYIVGSGMMTVIFLLAFRFCNVFQASRVSRQAGELVSERAPLLSRKDDDESSWGSYDSISHDEGDADEWLAANSIERKPIAEGENHRHLCIICFDAARDCFFLPCGHCAACFTCGTRIAEEAGTCPMCRRSIKKVRKIFTV